MKKFCTYEDLLSYNNQINSIQNTIIGHWFAVRTQEFYEKNGANVNHIIKQIEKLRREFLVFGEDDKLVMNGEEATYLEGKTKEELDALVKELLAEKIFVII